MGTTAVEIKIDLPTSSRRADSIDPRSNPNNAVYTLTRVVMSAYMEG
jgi:hypothetical protein